MLNVCYSGGAQGADELFGSLANMVGHKVIHWSFPGHNCFCKDNIVEKSLIDLQEADIHLSLANQYLKRKFPTEKQYINNLLRRNYFTVSESERVYAVTPFDDDWRPLGGTAWGIVIAMNMGIREIYNFNMRTESWFSFNGITWEEIEQPPSPHGKYTGIGSRTLGNDEIQAVKSLFDNS